MPLVFSGYNGNIGSDLTFKYAKVMFTDGVALFGSTTSSGQRLQVTGTMKVTGASSFEGNMTLSLNQNAATTFMISNTTVGTSSDVSFVLTSTNGIASFAKYNSSRNPYKILSSNDAFLYNGTSGDLAIFNDFASGNIKFAAGSSLTAQMTLTSVGSLGIGATSVNASAILQVDSTTKGFLPPRMTTTQKNAISSPAAGLVVYDTTLNKLCVYTTSWETITSI